MPPQEIQQSSPRKGSKISSAEWWLVIGALAFVDLVQIVLDLFAGIGAVVNRFIDIVVGMALPLYCHIRGVNLDTKRIVSMVASFFGEEIPVVDALPLWTLDGLLLMTWDKADKKLPSLPI